MLSVDVVRETGVDGFIVNVAGEIDMLTAPALAAVVEKLLTSRQAVVVVDFDGVSFLDSTAIAVLIDLRRVAHDTTGSSLVLRAMNERLTRLLRITHTHELFTWQ